MNMQTGQSTRDTTSQAIPDSNPDEKSVESLLPPGQLQGPFDIRSVALTGLFVLAILYTLYFMRAVLLPLVLAVLLSYLLRPLVRGLKKNLRIPPPLSSAILLVLLFTGIGSGIFFLSTPAAGWLEKAPYSLRQIQQKLTPLKKPVESVTKASGEIEKLAAPATSEGRTAIEVKRHPLTDTLYLQTPEVVVSIVLFLILLYFLLAYDGAFLPKLIKLLPTLSERKRAVAIAHDIEAQVSRYLLTITMINLGLGVAVGTAVGFLGLPNPVLWGALVALLNFIPYLGALTGIVCMTLGALLSFDSLGLALAFPAIYLSLAILEGNFITPWIMGRSLTLNPVIVLFSLIFWGWMWGAIGVILAVPILAAFKIFCAHIEPAKPLAEFLS